MVCGPRRTGNTELREQQGISSSLQDAPLQEEGGGDSDRMPRPHQQAGGTGTHFKVISTPFLQLCIFCGICIPQWIQVGFQAQGKRNPGNAGRYRFSLLVWEDPWRRKVYKPPYFCLEIPWTGFPRPCTTECKKSWLGLVPQFNKNVFIVSYAIWVFWVLSAP